MGDLRNSDLVHYSEIVVGGFTSARTRLRISVLLKTIPEYHVTYIEFDHENASLIKNADLVIGAGAVAREGILLQKPVIIVGDYGLGGVVRPSNFHIQNDNGFKGRVNGMKDEYFSLGLLEREIEISVGLTFQELKMMSNQMEMNLHNIDF